MHRLFKPIASLLAVALLVVIAPTPDAGAFVGVARDSLRCFEKTGRAASSCQVHAARLLAGPERAEPEVLDGLLDEVEDTVVRLCSNENAVELGYLRVSDMVLQLTNVCSEFAFNLHELVYGVGRSEISDDVLACQQRVYAKASQLRRRVTDFWGKRCIAPDARGSVCQRGERERKIAKKSARVARAIERKCGVDFDAAIDEPGDDLRARIASFVEKIAIRGEHYAQRIYPPEFFGQSAELGPHPVGVLTLPLFDTSRTNTAGTAPRPVLVEVYYPTTDAAVAGKTPDLIAILGQPIVETYAFRDVERAPGAKPVILFSHGNNGLRIQSFVFASHMASYGYIVVSPDHHGNTFLDSLVGVLDPAVFTNRPLDMRFVLDEVLARNATPGNFFYQAVDPGKIGASGHSFGGYTAFLLGGGDSGLGIGVHKDPRVRSILPQAPFSPFSDSFFPTIDVPTMIIGASNDLTTPFPEHQQRPFDLMAPGAGVVALAELDNAGHFTFSDFCEVPGNLLDFLGGAEEACFPRHLPWRYAHSAVNYLALNFFDATLLGDAEALARLDPDVVAGFDNVRYEVK